MSSRAASRANPERLVLSALWALTLAAPGLLGGLLLQAGPALAVASGLALSTALFLLFTAAHFRHERGALAVSASWRDYAVRDLHLYVMSLIVLFLVIGVLYLLPLAGPYTIALVDAAVAVIYLLLARYPLTLRLGARQVSGGPLLESARDLARRIGLKGVELYVLDWSKFRVANAFQSGRASVYISNYLIENMPEEELRAVIAHELAHSKRRHVAKAMAMMAFPALAGLNLVILGVLSLGPGSVLPALLLFVAGLVTAFVAPRLALRAQRRFELEADELGVRALGDPRPMIGALRRLAQLSGDAKGSLTHPSIDERIRRIESLA